MSWVLIALVDIDERPDAGVEQAFIWKYNQGGFLVNPLSAMGDFRHLVIVSFQVFSTERVHWNLIFLGEMQQWEVHWGKVCLSIGGCRLNGLRGTSSPFCRHPPILASQEQLALKRVNFPVAW
jgi:hypothetical protein